MKKNKTFFSSEKIVANELRLRRSDTMNLYVIIATDPSKKRSQYILIDNSLGNIRALYLIEHCVLLEYIFF